MHILTRDMPRHFPIGQTFFFRSFSSRAPKTSGTLTKSPCPASIEKFATDNRDSDAFQKPPIRVKNHMKSMSQIPGPRGLHGLPILGTILALHPFTNYTSSQFHLVFRDLHAKYGKIVLFTFGTKKGVLLFDPDLIDAAMRQEGIYPNRTSLPILEAYSSRRGVDLLSIRQGESWQQVRRPLQQGLSHRTVGSTLTDQFVCGEDLLSEIGRLLNTEGQLRILSMKRLFMKYVLEATAVITFNARLNIVGDKSGKNQGNEEFFDSLDQVFRLIAKSLYTIPIFKWYRTPLYNRFESAMDHVRRFCRKKIIVAREELKGHSIPDNLLRHLTEDENMSEEEITMVMSAILFGGTEMTSQALMWLMWLLGIHEDKQEKLFKEISDTCGDEATVSIETLQHMPYLKACLKESFRFIFPTVNGSMRIVPDDIILGDYFIPKDTWVLFGQNALSRSPEYFDSPDEYIPERWMYENQDPELRRKMALCVLPFGMGKRNCVGRRLAEQQVYVALIKILQRYKLSVPEASRDIGISYNVVAIPDKDLGIRFTART